MEVFKNQKDCALFMGRNHTLVNQFVKQGKLETNALGKILVYSAEKLKAELDYNLSIRVKAADWVRGMNTDL